MTAHITQLKILHGISLLCVCFIPGTSPVNTVSHNKDTIKRTFKCFCRLFAQKSDDFPRSAPPVRSHPLGNRGFGSSPPQRRISAGNRCRSCRFPSRPPSRENGIAERPQTLRYPEIKNIFSADHAQSTRGGHSKSSRPAKDGITLPHPSPGRGSPSAHSAPHTGRCRRRCR